MIGPLRKIGCSCVWIYKIFDPAVQFAARRPESACGWFRHICIATTIKFALIKKNLDFLKRRSSLLHLFLLKAEAFHSTYVGMYILCRWKFPSRPLIFLIQFAWFEFWIEVKCSPIWRWFLKLQCRFYTAEFSAWMKFE